MQHARGERIVPWLAAALCVASVPAQTREVELGVRRQPDGAVVAVAGSAEYPLGRFHALLIAVDRYGQPGYPNLVTPRHDVARLEQVLAQDYCFDADRITVLVNEQATREAVLEQLRRYAETLGPKDSLLVYFAGHGKVLSRNLPGQEGYWLTYVRPDEPQAFYRWLSFTELTQALNRLDAGHVLTIADACYAGNLLRETMPERRIPPGILAQHDRYSNHILTAGGNEPVADNGREIEGRAHSLFAYHLLRALEQSAEPYLTGMALASIVINGVAEDPDAVRLYGGAGGGQLPQFGTTPGARGTSEGQFVLLRSDASRQPARTIAVVPGLEDFPGYVFPGNVRAQAGPDGRYTYWSQEGDAEVEMVLVRPGRFLRPDSGRLHAEVHPFLIDRFEVTNARIRAFEDSGSADLARVEPEERSTRLELDGRPLPGEQPAFGFHLEEARAFARWARKDLPTERQWELAAGFAGDGLDLSRYPWGDDPAPLASFRGRTRWEPLDRSFDRSRWSGALHLATSLRELCEASDGGPNECVVRGGTDVLVGDARRLLGSPLQLNLFPGERMASTRRSRTIGFRCVVKLVPPLSRNR